MTNNTVFQIKLYQIIVVAILLRLIWAWVIPVMPVSDSNAYDVFAQNIWKFGTYGWTADSPSSYWPVGTSAIYSIFYRLFGHSYWPIVFFNITCTVGFIYFSQKLCDLFFEAVEIGRLTALLLACWPTLIMFTTILGSELPYMVASMAAVYFFVQYRQSILTGSILSGLLFAAAYYIRPLAIITLAICIFYLLIQWKNLKRLALHTSLCTIVMVLLVAPWACRNYELYGHLVTMSTNGGATLWMGNQPGTKGGYLKLPDRVNGLDEYTRNKVLKDEAISYIKEQPVAFLIRTVKKFGKFHLGETIGVTWNIEGVKAVLGEKMVMPLKLITQLYWSSVLMFAVIGVVLYYKQQGVWQLFSNPFLLIWLSTAAVHAIIVAQDRYHLPITPHISAFSAYTIFLAIQRRNIRQSVFKVGGAI